jgi:hypothetical protein
LRNQVDCFVLKSEDFYLRILNESFKVVSLFSYQGACCLSVCGGNSDRISCPGRFVKDFFNFFSEPLPPEAVPCLSQLIQLITLISVCQAFLFPLPDHGQVSDFGSTAFFASA